MSAPLGHATDVAAIVAPLTLHVFGAPIFWTIVVSILSGIWYTLQIIDWIAARRKNHGERRRHSQRG